MNKFLNFYTTSLLIANFSNRLLYILFQLASNKHKSVKKKEFNIFLYKTSLFEIIRLFESIFLCYLIRLFGIEINKFFRFRNFIENGIEPVFWRKKMCFGMVSINNHEKKSTKIGWYICKMGFFILNNHFVKWNLPKFGLKDRTIGKIISIFLINVKTSSLNANVEKNI